MSNIQNQKSGLAKLMATENLTVQHAKTHTASFDPKNRILTCPIWNEMSGDLYDLLMGHEVGHAIDTPAQGWHGAVHERGRNYKGFLNVVEDARIEKRQKRRYPGLRRSFANGFNELMNRDFFGLKGRDPNDLTFIDKLNLYTKSGYTLPLTFTKKEWDFVRRVQECETFDDVLKITNEIWDYSKEEQTQSLLPEDEFSFGMDDEGYDDDDYEIGSGEGDAETDGKGKNKAKAKGQGDEESDEESDDDSGHGNDGDEEGKTKSESKSSENGEDDEDAETGDVINRFKESQSTREHMEPRCETDENFRQNEQSLVARNAREYVYVNIPQPKLNRIITPAKRVQEILTNEFSKQRSDYESIANTLYGEFRKKNERFVSLLAKEFEMRKAADKFSKAKTSETGDLDINKVFKYQIDDNIFKKVMRVPKGKSHGLILLLDKSGSMSENLTASYEQILILAMFCRKVNIPFAAYGYGNADHIRELDFPLETKIDSGHSMGCFTENKNDMWLSSVYLREMINSRMSNTEFSKAVKNILCLMDTWSSRYAGGKHFYPVPSDSLSNTPLTEALIASQQVINEFRTLNNLDIVNLCVVHDGDADDICSYYTESNRNWFRPQFQNVILCDNKNKLQVQVPESDDGVRIAICDWLSKTTDVKIIGFYIAPENHLKGALRRRLFTDEINEILNQKRTYERDRELGDALTKYAKQLRKEKYLESKNQGYESFFILPGGSDLSVGDDDFEAPEKITQATLSKAFGKFTKAKQVNRVLVSRFIGMIAV